MHRPSQLVMFCFLLAYVRDSRSILLSENLVRGRDGITLTKEPLKTVKVRSKLECPTKCVESEDCGFVLFNSAQKSCKLYKDGEGETSSEDGWISWRILDGDGNVPEVYDDWCPVEGGYEMLSEDGPCIKFFYPVVLWEEANRTCASLAPYTRLLVLDTEKKNTLIKAAGMAINNQFQTGIAIGLSDHGGDGYKWVDGSAMSFSDWGIKASYDQLHCVYLQRWLNWRWRAHACTNTAHYICEAVRELI